MAEGGGLLNRYTALKPYRGFESHPLRQPSSRASFASRGGRRRATDAHPGVWRKLNRERGVPTIYVARSQTFQKWSADVGHTKHTYKVGVVEGEAAAAVASLNEAGFAGVNDWKLVRKEPIDDGDEAAILTRLAAREKTVDPTYYPKLKGARGIFKANIANVATQLLVRATLDGGDPGAIKPKAADVAAYLIGKARE